MKSKDSLIVQSYVLRSIGDWIFRFAVPLFLYERTHSASGTALGYALTFLPAVLLAVPAGVLADRVDKRTLLWVLDLAGFLLCLLLALLMRVDAPMETVYALIFLIASVGTFHHVAFQASIPLAVSRERWQSANSTVNAADSLLGALGPIFGAVVVVSMGYEIAVYVNAAGFLAATIVTLAFTRFTSVRVRSEPLGEMVRVGARVIGADPFLKFGVLLFLVNNFAFFLYLGVFVYYLKHDLGLSDLAVGLVYSVGGLGAIAGSFSAKRILGRSERPLRSIAIMAVLLGLATLPMAFRHPVVVALAWAVESFINALIMVTYFTERQLRVPTEALGRVISLSRMVAYTAIPLGAGAGAWAAEHVPIPQIILLSGLMVSTFGLCALRQSYRRELPAGASQPRPDAAEPTPDGVS